MSLPDPDHVPLGAGRAQARPLITTSTVIYAVLVLLAFVVPRALVNWTRNFEPNPVQELALRGAEAVQSLSHHIGLDRPYLAARELFLQVTGKRED